MLGDGTGFTGGHIGVTDSVLQRGFAVVHVAHEGNHGRTGSQLGLIHLTGADGGCFLCGGLGRRADDQLKTGGGANLFGVGIGNSFVDSGKFAQLDEVGQNFVGLAADGVGKGFHHDGGTQGNGVPVRSGTLFLGGAAVAVLGAVVLESHFFTAAGTLLGGVGTFAALGKQSLFILLSVQIVEK